MLTTDQKGAVAELAIAHAAVKLGIGVYRPVAEGGRYDMILEGGGRLIRVQCKWVHLRNNVMTIRCYSSRRGATGFINRAYSSTEIDALAAYCPDIDQCFLVPVARIDGRPSVHLRVAPARNNQIRGVNLAEDFDFAVTLRTLTGP